MNPLHRRQTILTLAAEAGQVSAGDLAVQFNVNPVTIRRDLALLENQGLLQRAHGGAVLSRRAAVEFKFLQKGQQQHHQKVAIALQAAGMIEPGMSLTIDTGTTTLEVARRIACIPQLKVLTSSLAVASVLYPHENIDLILLGGSVRKGSPDLSGMVTQENLRQFRVNVAIVGADAAGPDGLYTNSLEVASISRAILAGADRAVFVVDSSKFHNTALANITDWSHVDCLVTDAGVQPKDRKWLDDLNTQVIYSVLDDCRPEDSSP